MEGVITDATEEEKCADSRFSLRRIIVIKDDHDITIPYQSPIMFPRLKFKRYESGQGMITFHDIE